MRLDLLEDGEFKPNEIFSLEIKNHKCYFSVNGDKHVFGSKLYPLGKRAELFLPWMNNEDEIKYQEVAESIESGNWQPRNGYCYTNAEVLYQSFKAHGIDAKYFSGWLFPTGSYPVHHAWTVVDGCVYDIAVNTSSQELQEQQVKEGRDPYSKECLREVKQAEKNWKPIVDNFTWGKVRSIYIGAENTPNGARLQYNNCVRDVSTHPSYKSMGKTGKHIKSRYQSMLEEI